MSDLSSLTPSQTYKSLLKVSNDANQILDGTLRSVEDGMGTDSLLQLSTGAVNITGAGTLQYNGTAITSTATELNLLDGVSGLVQADFTKLAAVDTTASELNLVDGGTARGTTAVVSGDGILINDAGTMRMTNVDTISTYFSSHNVGGGNIVTTGNLNSGSITSGFGAINNGASAITTTGLISGGSLDIDDVLINGTTIGHTSDTDLMTLTAGTLVIAGDTDISGKVGIGIAASTQHMLHIDDDSSPEILIREDDTRFLRIKINASYMQMGWDDADFMTFGTFANKTTASFTELVRIEHTGKVRIGGSVTPSGQLNVDTAVSDAAIPVLTLDQADIGEEMIEFLCTIGTGNAIEAVAGKSLTTTHFIKVTIQGGLTRYLPVGTIA